MKRILVLCVTIGTVAFFASAINDPVCTAPSISAQPTSQSKCTGQSVSFTVGASGSSPLSYRWRKNTSPLSDGGNISGSATATLNVSNLATSDGGLYDVVVNNACGSATSSAATLTVTNTPPIITAQPTSQTKCQGQSASFTVAASGGQSFQWRRNFTSLSDGTNVFGSTTATLTIISVGSGDAAAYDVVVGNFCGTTNSAVATLTVQFPPSITAQPTNQTVNAGGTASFSVGVGIGTPPFAYQWYFNTNTPISGGTNATLMLTNVQMTNAGNYSVVVANTCGTASSSNAFLTVQVVSCFAPPSGLVGWWPAEGNANDIVGGNNGAIQNVGFTNGIAGQAFVFRGPSSDPHSRISVPDQPLYALTNSLSIEGWINPAGMGGNSGVILWRGDCRAGYDPYFFQLQGDDTLGFYIEDGPNSAAVVTTVPLTLNQWWHVAATLEGTNGNMRIYTNGVLAAQTYTAIRPFGPLISSLQPTLGIGNVGTPCWDYVPFNGLIDEISLYNRALTTNEIQGIYSSGAQGKCLLPPIIISQPTNATITYGQSAVYSVQASGILPLQYQWLRNGTNIPGATWNSYTFGHASVADSGSRFSVIVSNNYGSTLSSTGILTVLKAPLTVRADNKAKVYCAINPALSWTAVGLVYGEGTNVLGGNPQMSTTVSNTSNAGNYTITITNGTLSATNYSFTFVNGVFSVVKAPLTFTAGSKTRAYGAANPLLTWSIAGFVNGEGANVLSGTPQTGTPAGAGSGVGGYPITITTGSLSATNYSFAFINGTLTVTQALLTVTANSASRTYGANNPVFTAGYSGFLNGDTSSVLSGAPSLTTSAVSTSPVGNYAISAAVGTLSAANYNLANSTFINGSLTIGRANLLVLADNKTKYVGQANPVLTYTLSGLLAGDATNVVSGAPVLSAANANSPGAYTITNDMGLPVMSATNYNFILSNGVLTVLAPSSQINLSTGVLDYLIGSPPTVMDSNVTVTALGSASFDNATLTASFVACQAGDHLSVLDAGTGVGQISVTNASAGIDPYVIGYGTASGTANIATFTPGSPTNDLVVTFTTNVTSAHVQAVARSLTYYCTSTSPSSNPRGMRCHIILTNGCHSGDVTNVIYPTCPTNIQTVLVIDRTPSMGTKDVNTTNIFGSDRLAAAKSAAISFLGYPEFPGDKVKVIDFCGGAPSTDNPTDLTTNFLGDATTISNVISKIVTNSGCAGTIYPPALHAAYTNLVGFTNSETLRLIIFLTDGEQTDATQLQPAINDARSNRLAGIRLITIGLGSEISSNDTTAVNARALLTKMASSPEDFHISTNGTGLTGVYSNAAYSACRVANLPPTVYAGPDATNAFAAGPYTVSLAGFASDDGLPTPPQLTSLWTGPAGVTFANATITNTTATFPAPGTYSLQLRASDGALSATDTVSITVQLLSIPPTVSIMTPSDGDSPGAPASISLTARAQDLQGVITNVSYFRNTNGVVLGSSTASPFQVVLTNLLHGNYQFVAVAWNDRGLSSTSSAVNVTVLPQWPVVSVTAPQSNAVFSFGEPIVIQATATDADGVVTNVDFRRGPLAGIVLGSDTNAPYTFTWTNAPAVSGILLRAVATDNDGLISTSAPVSITVQSCAPPGVSNLVLSVPEILGGGQLSGTVVLSNAATTGGQAVNLYSSSAAVIVPAYVFVPAGQLSGDFDISVLSVGATTNVTISATYHGQAPYGATLQVVPNYGGDGAQSAVRPGFDATDVYRNDDGYVGPIEINFPILFYCQSYSNLWIDNNGLLTFNAGYSPFTPDIPISQIGNGPYDDGISRPAIAPFWADVDTRADCSNPARYGTNIVDGHKAFGVTWQDVGYYANHCDKTNSFQVVLIDRSDTGEGNFDIEFNYERIQWETGDVSYGPNGDPSGGFGGSPARFGYGNGQGDGFELAGSSITGALVDTNSQGLIHNSYNSIVPGRYVFPIRCTASGSEVFVRDDTVTTHSPFVMTAPAMGAGSVENASFDTHAISGSIFGAFMERSGLLQHDSGARMDLELGIASVQGPACSFGLLWPAFNTSVSPTNYLADWMLSDEFNADLQGQLGGEYHVQFTNRSSSICGASYAVTDAPATQFPLQKDILTFAATTDRNVPQGRCRSFILDTSDAPPLNGEWDIVQFDQVIASSGNPNGWDVEDNYTAFGGSTISVPASAAVGGGYELRVLRPGWLIARSVRFSVAPQGSFNTAPVLRPLAVSTNAIVSTATLSLSVTLDAPAPFGGAYVTLHTNGLGGCVVPPWVVIPAGQTSVSTNIQVNGNVIGTLEISAEFNGYRKARVQVVAACEQPDEPQNLSATDSTRVFGVLLAWNSVSNAATYSISRSTNNGLNFSTIFSGLAATNFVDTGVLPDIVYTYQVSAWSNWCSSLSTNLTITPARRGPAPTPWILPFGGTFNDEVDVLLTNLVSGTVMYFTTNGTIPSPSSASFVNGGVVHLTASATFQAYTYHVLEDGQLHYDADSRVVSANFVIANPIPIYCGRTNSGSLTRTNAYSTTFGPGWYDSRFVYNAGIGDIGKLLTLTASSADFDTFLFLEDASNKVLLWNDDYLYPDSTDSQINCRVSTNGTYVIEVTSYSPQETGDFTLSLACQDAAQLNVLTNAFPTITSNSAALPLYSLVDFGLVPVGVPITNYITLTNSGNGDLNISNIAVFPAASTNAGNGFSIWPTNPITLPHGGITNLAVTLYSTNLGGFDGYFIFDSNDSGSGSSPPAEPFWAEVKGNVGAAPGMPLVLIYYPTDGMTVPATNSELTNVTLEIDAVAIDANGIKQVDFLTNGVLFQTVLNAPYTAYWTNPPAGRQTITAKAYDLPNPANTGQASVAITVGTPLLTLSPTNACVGLSNTTFTVTATLRDATNGLVANSNVVFIVTGTHTMNYTNTTAANGQASFTYTGTNAGLDTIVAVATSAGIPVVSQPVLKNWAMRVSCGGTYAGTLTNTDGTSIACGCAMPSHYTDFYSISGLANDVITFKLTSTNFSAFMFLMNTNCAPLNVTNEMLNLTDAQMRVSLPSNGTYVVEATSADIFQTGNYTLSVTCGTPTAPNITVSGSGTNLANYALLDLGSTTNGTALSRTIGITNKGNATLNIAGYSYYYGLSNVFSITPSPVTSLAAGAGAVFTVQFLSANSGQYVDALVLTNNDPNKNPFVINLGAISNPEGGAPPTVTITAPTNNSRFIAPATITVSANAAASGNGATITNVIFGFRTTQGAFQIGSNSAPPFSIVWTAQSPGNYSLFAVAYDSQGRAAISTNVVNVEVDASSQNHPPVAVRDYPVVLANSRNNLLDVLTNDYDPDGDALTITKIIPSTTPGPHGTAMIVDNGKRISYTPMPGYGSTNLNLAEDGFSYQISDGKGGTALGGVYVIFFATELPHIAITNPAPIDGSVTLYTGTTNNVMVDIHPIDSLVKVQYWISGDLIGEVTNAFNVFPWYIRGNQCGCGLRAVAIDKYGQQGVSDPAFYKFSSPDGSPVPYAQIDSPSLLADAPQVSQNESIEREAVIADGMLVVTGSVYQQTPGSTTLQPAEYKVVIESQDGTVLRDSGWQPSALIQHGPIYTNDLTTLQNDSYNVELFVRNDYQTANAKVPFILNSSLKLGVFTFSEQDLVIPAGGTPLSVIRTYNSMNPILGDFGYSWTYALQELNVTFHEDRGYVRPSDDNIDDVGPAYSGSYFSIREGGSRDITLTLPNGQRTTFYYYEKSCGSINAYACSYYYAPPEAHAQLRPVDANGNDLPGVLQLISGYYVWPSSGGDTPYDNYDFPAFILTLDDGTQYFIVRDYQGAFDLLPGDSGDDEDFTAGSGFYYKAYSDKARVAWIKLPSGEKIVIDAETSTPTGNQFSVDYLSVSGQTNRSIYFLRNPQGQISAVMDPASGANGLPVIKYEYDNNLNLSRVEKLVDRTVPTYTTNTYLYENGNFPHYLTKILDPRGVALARNLYDDSGKLIGVIDANGKTNLFVYDIGGSSETVFDRMGHQTTYVYDTRGNVTTSIDALNHVTQSTYDGQNNLTSTTDALTNTTYYAYDGNGNRTQVVDPRGHTNLFSYDANNNLLTQTNPVGTVTQNQYDSAGNLTNTIQYDSLGNILLKSSSTYVEGRLAQTFDGNNRVTATFTYDASGNLTNSTDANGFSRSSTYDANGNRIGASYVGQKLDGTPVTIATTNVYDAAGRVTVTIDAKGNTNQTFYSSLGKVDHTIDQFGNSNSFLYDARGNLIQTISPFGTNLTVFDDNARPILATDRNGISGTLTKYDPVGRVTSTIRTTNAVVNIVADPNNPGQFISQIGSTGVPYSTNSTAYYDNGWVLSRTTPDGQTTSYQYWADGQTMRVTDPLTNQTFYFYDEAGRQSQVSDALNHSTRLVYDALGRQMATVFADGSSITNQFDNLGQRVGQIDQAGLRTQFGYSVSGLLTNVIKPQVLNPVNSQMVPPQWTYQYDDQGHLLVTTDPNGHSTTNTFDELGRQARYWLTLGQVSSNQFNARGQLWKQYDFKHQWTEFVYDNFGRTKAKFLFNAGATYPSNSVCYQYNSLGQLATIIERYGQDASTNTCDGYTALLGPPGGVNLAMRAKICRALAKVPADIAGGMLGFALLAFALAMIPSAKRRLLTLWLIETWRMQHALLASGSASVLACCGRRPRRTLRLRLPSIFWRLTTMVTLACLVASDPNISRLWTAQAQCSIPSNASTPTTRYTYFTYDCDGHLTQVNCPEGVINYGYDMATGRLTSTCTLNSYVAYGYDALGRLQTVTASKRNGVVVSETTTYGYDAVGNRKTVSLPNWVVTTYLYDSLNRLTNLTHQAGTTNLASYSYLLSASGRRTNAVEVLRQEDGTYLTNVLAWQFDGMYRLTNEVSISTSPGGNYAYTNAYQYDLAGNRLMQVKTGASVTTITNAYDANDELLREVTKVNSALTDTNSYAYDLNGSVTGKTNSAGTVAYTYNVANKLNGVWQNGTLAASYLYSDQGIRVQTTSGTTTHYLIDANNKTGYAQVLEELATLGGTPSMSYVLGDEVLAQCGAMATAPSYFLTDGHGSNRQLTQMNGMVTSHYSYEAFGAVQANTSTSTAEYAVNNNVTSKLYCGEQYDSNLQMYNLRARYYNPANGRFNQRDTFAGNNDDPQTLHKYLYANCDPVNRIDRNGNFTVLEVLIVVAIIFVLFTTVASLLHHASKGARRTLGRAELEQDVDLKFTLKAGAEKMLDDTVVAGAKLKRFPEYINRLAEVREKIDKVDKVVGLAAFCREAQLIVNEQKEREFLAACTYETEDPEGMDLVLKDVCGGKSWEDLDEAEVQSAGQQVLALNLEPGMVEFYVDLEELIKEGADVSYSLP